MKVKKVPKGLKEFVIKCAREHAWNLKIQHYNVTIEYKDSEKASSDLRTGDVIAADIEVQRRYLAAVIRIYPTVYGKWERGEKKEINEIIGHELSHILTQHFFDLAVSCYKDEGETKDAWESLTESIGRLSCKIQSLETKLAKKK